MDDTDTNSSEDSSSFIKEIIVSVGILVAIIIAIISLVVSFTKSGKQGPQGETGPSGSNGSIGPQGLEGPPGKGGTLYYFNNGSNGVVRISSTGYAVLTNIMSEYAQILPFRYNSGTTANNSVILGNTTSTWTPGSKILLSNIGNTSDYSTFPGNGDITICSGCKSNQITNCNNLCNNNDPIFPSRNFNSDGTEAKSQFKLVIKPGNSTELILDQDGYVRVANNTSV